MAIRLYHRTTDNAAATILAEGFREGPSEGSRGRVGAWFSRELDCWGEQGRELLEVMLDATEAELEPYAEEVATEELDDETGDWIPAADGEAFTWYVIPAAVVNERGHVRLVSREERRRLDSGWRPEDEG
jgi:hypothetical protein